MEASVWYPIMSAIISVVGLIISIYTVRNNKDLEQAKTLKQQFDKLQDLLDQHTKLLGVLEERLKTETGTNEKYRDKMEVKMDDVIKIIYKTLKP